MAIAAAPCSTTDRLTGSVSSAAENLRVYASLLRDGKEPETCELGHMSEYFLEIIAEVGQPFTAVITLGGPHIELIFHHTGDAAYVSGHWGPAHAEEALPADTAATLFGYLFPDFA